MNNFSVQQFIDECFGGEAVAAMLEVARVGQIAVAYQYRATFEADLGRELSDEEWERIVPELEDYDEWLDNSGAGEPISTWRAHVLDRTGVIL